MRSILLATITTSLLAGCASDIRRNAQNHTAATAAQADRDLAVRRNLEANRGPGNVRIKDGVWLGDTGTRISPSDALPKNFSGKNAITLKSDRPLSLDQIATRLSEITGIRHSVESISLWQGDRASGAGNTDAFDTSALTGPIAGVSAPPMNIKYTGSLAELEEMIANHFDVDWEYRDGVVMFTGLQTRQFTLEAMPAQISANAQIQGGLSNTSSSGSGSSGGNAQSSAQQGVTSTFKSDYWTQAENTLKSMLPPNTPYSINRDAGTITVTARASVLRAVERYMRSENERLGRQVAIQVKVLSVQFTDNENYNFDFNAVFQDVASGLRLGFQTATPVGALSNVAAGSVGIVQGTSNTANKFQGSQAFIRALSERVNTSLVTQASTTALNNQVTPISVLNQRGYLQSRTDTTVAGSTNASVSLNPGTINTGFSMTVTPRILANNDLLLNYNISLSTLLSLDQIGTADNFIQTPNVDSRSILQSVRLRSGDTLVLAGFEQTNNQQSDRGIGKPTFWFLGGGTDNTNSRQMIVFVITPVILDGSSQLQAAQR